jgi:hypothetical protein
VNDVWDVQSVLEACSHCHSATRLIISFHGNLWALRAVAQ